MWTPLNVLKQSIERIAGVRVFRNTLPHGIECFFDISRRFGRNNIHVIFDVGANIGQSALKYVHQFPDAEIHAFEPVSATYQQLVAATRSFSKIHTYHLGMGSTPGEIEINVHPDSCQSSILLKRPEDRSETTKLETISEFAERHNINAIDYLKIDTESYEIEVLTGAIPLLREQKIHFIQCECEPLKTSDRFVAFADLCEFLTPFGYRLFGVYEQQPDWERNELLYWNAVFVCGKLVLPHSRI